MNHSHRLLMTMSRQYRISRQIMEIVELIPEQTVEPVMEIREQIPVKPIRETAVETAVELANELKMEKITGTIVIVKVVCPEEFEQRAGSLCLDDRKNLNRQFPGDEKGTRTQRLANAIKKELHSVADYYIDLHSGDDYEQLTPYIYYAGCADEDVVQMSRKMAEQADVPYMVKSNVASGGSYNYAATCGIPSVLIERGQMGGWSPEEVHSTRKDVRNILCALGVYDGMRLSLIHI